MDCVQCGEAVHWQKKDMTKVLPPDIYNMSRMSEILYWCERTGRNYWEYVQQCEDEDIWDYLAGSMENHERIHRTRLGPGRSITRSAELTQKGFYLLY